MSAWSFAGRLRGRPGLPTGRLIGSMASSSPSKATESCTLAAVSATASGTPLRSETTWRFEPGLPRSVGFLPTCSPPFGRHARRVQACPRPVDAVGSSEAVEQDPMQPPPHSGLLPVPEPPPARTPGPAAHLPGQHLPGYAALEDEDDAGQRRPVVHTRPAAFGFRRLFGQKRLDRFPQLSRYEFLSHTAKRSISSRGFCKELLTDLSEAE